MAERPTAGPMRAWVESTMCRFRLFAALALVVWAAADRGGSAHPTAWVTLILGLPAVNVISAAASRARDQWARLLRAHELVADTALALLIASGVTPLGSDVAWVVLLVPILEAALRYRLRGAIAAWASAAGFYVAGSMVAMPAEGVGGAPGAEHLGALVQRMALLLLLAVCAGLLIDQLLRAVGAQRHARQQAEARNRLLEVVVGGVQQASKLDGAAPQVVVRSAASMGFHDVDLVRLDRRTSVWTVEASWQDGGPASLPSPEDCTDPAEVALERKATVIIEAGEADMAEREMLERHHLSALVLASVGTAEHPGLLRAALGRGPALSPYQVECLDLLARQVGVAVDNQTLVAQLRTARDRLDHAAHHDALTGLPNRAMFQRELECELARPAKSPVAVLFIDLDRFKCVNDALGHPVGDELLEAVGRRLRGAVRAGALVARLGGDEFVVLTRVSRVNSPDRLAERLLSTLSAPFVVHGQRMVVSASIGIAVADASVGHPEELMRRADAAMYRAKAKGPGNHQSWSPSLESTSIDQVRLETDLSAAADSDQLRLVYQPIVSVRTGAILGVEALLRWSHPEYGPIPPSEFIPLAEDSGLIVDLGRWALVEACRQTVRWPKRGFGAFTSVNVSPRQLARGDFAETVATALSDTRLPPARLLIEVTERLLGDDSLWSELHALRRLGVRIAVDDFGAGQTSLRHLRHLPFDFLKIDREFVQGAAAEDRVILESVVRLGQELAIPSIAEGVETEWQLDLLRQLQCEAAQGFLFYRPLEAADVARALMASRLRRPAPARRLPRAGRPRVGAGAV